MLNQPTSSPMMTRMLGFFSCAKAGVTGPVARPMVRTAAKAVIATFRFNAGGLLGSSVRCMSTFIRTSFLNCHTLSALVATTRFETGALDATQELFCFKNQTLPGGYNKAVTMKRRQ